MPDLTLTRCPYCKDDVEGRPSTFHWRVVELETKPSNIPGEHKKIPAIEIYCERCEHVFSITPVLTERAAEALSVL